MYKKDYLMQLVAQLTAVITQAARLRDDDEYQEALDTTDGALRQLTGLGTNAWLSMATEDILANLSMRDDLGGVETAVFMVGIFYQEGELYAAQDDDDRADYRFLRTLQLQLALLNTYPDIPLPSVVATVPALNGRLTENGVILPAATNHALMVYYEATGAFSTAEDILYDWIDAEPGSSEALEAGIALYQQLLLKPDEELEAGNLPRDEVTEGLEDLLQATDE